MFFFLSDPNYYTWPANDNGRHISNGKWNELKCLVIKTGIENNCFNELVVSSLIQTLFAFILFKISKRQDLQSKISC